MSKLLQDPKVAELVGKETAKATKAQTKRILAIVKDISTEQVGAAKEGGQKELAKALSQIAKDITAAIKA